MFWDATMVTAQQAPEELGFVAFVFFFLSFSSWCRFYLFSNYVFIFYGVHRVLMVAKQPLTCADEHTMTHARTSGGIHTHTHTHTHTGTHTWSHKQWKMFNLESLDKSLRCC